MAQSALIFEERMARDSTWALCEGSKFFEGGGAVQFTLRKIAARLRDLGIPFAAVGGIALFHHGLRRFTIDVDLLVTREGLKELHSSLVPQGYVPRFTGSKNLRDVETGVSIKFLVTGEYPGNGTPNPVVFPDPAAVAVDLGGVVCADLPKLIELKLASGMTAQDRLKDLADVQELIKILNLQRDFANQLNPYVQSKYDELWTSAQPQSEINKE